MGVYLHFIATHIGRMLKTANKPIGHLMGAFVAVQSTFIKNPLSCQALTCCLSNNISLVFFAIFLNIVASHIYVARKQLSLFF